MHDDLTPDNFNEHLQSDPELAALDDFIHTTLTQESADALPPGLIQRTFRASVTELADRSAPLRFAVDDDPGPSMLPPPLGPWWAPFAVIAAGLVLAIGLTLRFGTQMLNNKPAPTIARNDTGVDINEIDERFQRLNLVLASSRADAYVDPAGAEIALEAIVLESRFESLQASILSSSLRLNDPAAQLIEVRVDDAADYSAWIAAQLDSY